MVTKHTGKYKILQQDMDYSSLQGGEHKDTMLNCSKEHFMYTLHPVTSLLTTRRY